MKNKLGADGDFAQGYVIAHEVGHHVQKLLGIGPKVRQLAKHRKQRVNRLSVRMGYRRIALPACGDTVCSSKAYWAGVWKKALNAAQAIGDDRLHSNGAGARRAG